MLLSPTLPRNNNQWIFAPAIALVLISIFRMALPASMLRVSFVLSMQIGIFVLFALFLHRHVNRFAGWFLLLCLISAVIPTYTKESLLTIYAIQIALIWFAIIVLCATPRTIKYLMDAICLIAFLNIIHMLGQALHPETFNYWNTGVMANPNEISGLLAISLPAFMRTEWRGWKYFKFRMVVFIPMILIGLFMARSTGGVLAAFCGLVFYFFYKLRSSPAIIVSIIALIISAAMFVLYVDMPGINRVDPWFLGYQIIWQHPVIGIGIGHWAPLFAQVPIKGLIWNTAHNDILQAWAEIGTGFMILLLFYLRDIGKRAIKSGQIIIPFMALIIILANCSVNFLFHIATTALIAVTWLAILEVKLNVLDPNGYSSNRGCHFCTDNQ